MAFKFAAVLLLALAATASAQSLVDQMKQENKLKGLVGLIEALNQQDTVNNIGGTLFAPTNKALAKFAKDYNINLLDFQQNMTQALPVVLFHVATTKFDSFQNGNTSGTYLPGGAELKVTVDGNMVTVGGTYEGANSAEVTEPAVAKSNTAVVYLVDSVLLPPGFAPAPAPAPEPTPSPEPTPAADIMTVLEEKNLTLLAAAVMATGLEPALMAFNGTLFAPTDDAFIKALDAFGISDIQAALEDENLVNILREVLMYHASPEHLHAVDLMDGEAIPTLLDNQEIMVEINGTMVMLIPDNPDSEAAMVIEANIEAGDAVLHIIDTVLIPDIAAPTPPGPSPPPLASAAVSTAAVSKAAAAALALMGAFMLA